jgi:hypothetical protein
MRDEGAALPLSLRACTVAVMRRAVTDFQLIRYIDSTLDELIAECGACRHEDVLDVAEIISMHGANLWIGELRERLQCRQCGARTPSIFARPLLVMPF